MTIEQHHCNQIKILENQDLENSHNHERIQSRGNRQRLLNYIVYTLSLIVKCSQVMNGCYVSIFSIMEKRPFPRCAVSHTYPLTTLGIHAAIPFHPKPGGFPFFPTWVKKMKMKNCCFKYKKRKKRKTQKDYLDIRDRLEPPL